MSQSRAANTPETLPTPAETLKASEGLFEVQDVHEIGPDYKPTLIAWYENFKANWPKLRTEYSKYDERFYRLWTYYLQCCAPAFGVGIVNLKQHVFTRPGFGKYTCVR